MSPSAPTVKSLEKWLLLALLVALYGSAFSLTKVAVDTISPLTLVLVRLTIGAVLLTAVAYLAGHRLPRLPIRRKTTRSRQDTDGYGPWGAWAYLALLSIMGNVMPFGLISWGQQDLSSGLAGILMAIMPLFTMGLAALFVAGEHITPARLAGFLLGFAGLGVLFAPSAGEGIGGDTWLQQIALLLGACCYGINAILTKNRPALHPLAAGAAIHICAVLIVLPLAFLLEDPLALAPSAASLGAAIGLGIFPSSIATLVILILIDKAGPTFTSQINYLIPFWAVGVGFVFLGEVPDPSALIALGLIIAGIALAEWGSRRMGRRETADQPKNIQGKDMQDGGVQPRT